MGRPIMVRFEPNFHKNPRNEIIAFCSEDFFRLSNLRLRNILIYLKAAYFLFLCFIYYICNNNSWPVVHRPGVKSCWR